MLVHEQGYFVVLANKPLTLSIKLWCTTDNCMLQTWMIPQIVALLIRHNIKQVKKIPQILLDILHIKTWTKNILCELHFINICLMWLFIWGVMSYTIFTNKALKWVLFKLSLQELLNILSTWLHWPFVVKKGHYFKTSIKGIIAPKKKKKTPTFITDTNKPSWVMKLF